MRVGGDVFVGKINVRFDVREGLHQLIAQGLNALAELAGELFVGGCQSEIGAGMNHVTHGLGLCEINAAIDKRAPRKFPRQGTARAGGQHGLQHRLTGHHAAMAGNLHGIFSRKCPWRTHHSKQHFIHRTVVRINNVPVVDGVRSGFGGFGRVHSSGPKTPVGHHHSVIARKADDRQRAFT